MTDKFIPTIGLEIHAELQTKSKMFCRCKNDPDEQKVNLNICPICLAQPGSLPVVNFEAVRHVLRLGLAIDGTLANFTEWDRKNYFYPDIPKGYQISQYKFPLVSGGKLLSIEIERVHLEEDTASSTHDVHEKSLINFNRSGVPLMELVTKPVIHDAKTAAMFARELQLLLRTLGAGQANLEKGEMRVEANISVASPEATARGQFGTKTEVKNLNSFKAVEKAIAFEIERQKKIVTNGQKVIQETRGYDDRNGETYSQRIKESSHDYRYFPDPDIPKFMIENIPELSSKILRDSLPELPWDTRARYKKTYTMTDKEIQLFLDSPQIADYFQSVVPRLGDEPKKTRLAINYIVNNFLGKIYSGKQDSPVNSDDQKGSPLKKIDAERFAELIGLIHEKKISSTGANTLIDIALSESESLNSSFLELAKREGLLQNSNDADLKPLVAKVISDNSTVVAEYKGGKLASLQYLIGQGMKLAKGSANPEIIKKLLVQEIESLEP